MFSSEDYFLEDILFTAVGKWKCTNSQKTCQVIHALALARYIMGSRMLEYCET